MKGTHHRGEKVMDHSKLSQIELEIQKKLSPLFEKLDSLDDSAYPLTIVIDGRCASGKTTAAMLISKLFNAPVIHTDDFFLPPEMRTAERLSEPGGNIDRERFLAEAVQNLKLGKSFRYGKFDCKLGKISHFVTIPVSKVTVIEGAYSMHPCFGNYADIGLFFDIPYEKQLERIRKRNGDDSLEIFKNKWIPLEEAYFKAYRPHEFADIIIENRT